MTQCNLTMICRREDLLLSLMVRIYIPFSFYTQSHIKGFIQLVMRARYTIVLLYNLLVADADYFTL
jgi:hypothetical protein